MKSYTVMIENVVLRQFHNTKISYNEIISLCKIFEKLIYMSKNLKI